MNLIELTFKIGKGRRKNPVKVKGGCGDRYGVLQVLYYRHNAAERKVYYGIWLSMEQRGQLGQLGYIVKSAISETHPGVSNPPEVTS